MNQHTHMLLSKRILGEVRRQYVAALKQLRDGKGRRKADWSGAAGAKALAQAYRTSLLGAYRMISREYADGQIKGIRDLARVYETLLDYAPAYGGKGRRAALAHGEAADGNVEVSLHLKHSAKSGRRPQGSYYTPDEIITYIVERTLRPIVRPLSSSEILNLKILDPAMGSGLFLVEAASFLAAAYGQTLVREGKAPGGVPEGEEFEKHRRLIAESCLHGVDIDPGAVQIARLLLGLLAGSDGATARALTRHLKHGNSLLGAASGEDPEDYEALYRQHVSRVAGGLRAQGDREAPRLFHWEREFPEVFRCRGGRPGMQPGFDAVIGNPPYLSYSGRHRAGDREGVSAIYRSLGRAAGWITSHGLFMIRALDLVKQGGLVSMIVPDQVGHLKGYSDLRHRMREQGHLVEVKYWGEGVFGEVTTPSMTFVVRKSRTELPTQALMIDRQGKRTRFRPEAGDEWHWSPARQVFEDLVGRHTVLEGFSDPGVHTGNVAGKLILEHRRKGAVPVLEGKQIRAFYCSAPVRWLNRNYRRRAGEYFRLSPEGIYTETDIVLRQTAVRPIAARHVHRCYFRNSVLALRVPDGFSIEYVLGILNSDAVAWLYKASAFESGQRAFPQVKVGRLRCIPFPDPALPPNRQSVQRIEEIVRALEDGTATPKPEARLVKELNRRVRELYGLEAVMRDGIASLRSQ